MTTVLNVLAPLIGLVASAVGVVVALDQLIQRSRMRRVAQWTKELAEVEHDSERARVLHQIQAWAAAHLTASVLVPARYFADALVTLAGVPLAIFAVFAVGHRVGRPPDAPTIIAVLVLGFVALWLSLGFGVRAYWERSRVASEYLNRVHVRSPDLRSYLHLRTELTWRDRGWAAVVAAGACAFSAAVADLVFFRPSDWALPVIVLGFGAIAQGADTIRRKAARVVVLDIE